MKKHLLLGLLFVGLWSCKKEINVDQLKVDNIDPSFGTSLLVANLTVEDFVNYFDSEDVILIDNNNLLSLRYTTDDMVSVSAENFINFDFTDQNFNYNLTAGEQTNWVNNGSLTFNYTYDIAITNPTGSNITEALFKQGALNLVVNPSFTGGNITISSTQVSKGGQNLNLTSNVDGSPINFNYDLNGALVQFTPQGGGLNTITLNCAVTITNGNTPIPSPAITFNNTFNNVAYRYVRGDFATQTIDLNADTVDIKFFNKTYGDITFSDPTITFFIRNSIGCDLGVNVTQASMKNRDNVLQNITGTGISNFPIVAGAPDVGGVHTTAHILNNSNTSPSITDLILFDPNKAYFDKEAVLNPNGTTGHHIEDTSRISIKAQVDLPFFGTAANMVTIDTLDLNVENTFGDTSFVESVVLRIIANNGLPCYGNIQFYFQDSAFNVIDSVMVGGPYLLESGVISSETDVNSLNYGRVVAPVKTITDVVLSKEKYRKLVQNKSTKLSYILWGETTNAGNTEIKFYADNSFYLKLSARVNTSINL